jgi:hypothetical protein
MPPCPSSRLCDPSGSHHHHQPQRIADSETEHWGATYSAEIQELRPHEPVGCRVQT